MSVSLQDIYIIRVDASIQERARDHHTVVDSKSKILAGDISPNLLVQGGSTSSHSSPVIGTSNGFLLSGWEHIVRELLPDGGLPVLRLMSLEVLRLCMSE